MKVSTKYTWVWMGSSSEHRLAFILVVINNLQHLEFSILTDYVRVDVMWEGNMQIMGLWEV
jgi:hypothetical protein